MNTRVGLTKALAVLGTALLSLPLLLPLFFALASLVTRGRFLLDYLMPAELFPLALLGGALLLWAALRAHARRGLIGGSLAAAVLALVLSQALAVITGLASGAAEPEGWRWALVLGLLLLYAAALAAGAVAGGLLTNDLRRRT